MLTIRIVYRAYYGRLFGHRAFWEALPTALVIDTVVWGLAITGIFKLLTR